MSGPLLDSLFQEVDEPQPMTVTQLNAVVKGALEKQFPSVRVEGEISNFMAAASGHWYFTLRDANSQLRAACYKASNNRIRFKPVDGLQVRVRGKLTLYGPRGEYQMLVESLEPVGEGALRVAFEQIKAKLNAEGLFDQALKRPLPAFPKRIGVVTSPTGAAFFDILHVLSRRARSVNIILIPTRVQGDLAGEEICDAIDFANRYNDSAAADGKIDVLIVGRGGGSAEDLWAFNQEAVARAIRHSAIPVISAVGHEVDVTIADLVADMRAATPSAAAEIVAQREEDISRSIANRAADLSRIMNYKLLAARNEVQVLALSPGFSEVQALIGRLSYTAEELRQRLERSTIQKAANSREMFAAFAQRLSPGDLAARTERCRTRLATLVERRNSSIRGSAEAKNTALGVAAAKLDALSPLSVLKRGFSITETAAGKVVKRSSEAPAGTKLVIRLADGKLDAEVLASE